MSGVEFWPANDSGIQHPSFVILNEVKDLMGNASKDINNQILRPLGPQNDNSHGVAKISNLSTVTTLDQLKVGERGVIESYAQATDLQGRLKELGLVRGTMISVERFAPLGDPVEIQVRGYHLAIRKKDAAQIRVSRLNPQGKK